jgi:hypothetical protein
VGYFGPISRAKYTALVQAGGDDDDDDDGDDDGGPLEGGAGSVESYDLMSGLSNEEVGEDEEDVEVAGLEIEVDEGSDIELTAVRLVFTDVGAANNDDDLDEYASEVSIWLDGEEVARVDADEFNDDNNYTSTVSLDDAIIRAGETGELVVGISGIANLDDASAGDSWDVDFRQVRFMDADGATISEDPTENPVVFTFESFATANNIELHIEEGDDTVEEGVVEVSDTGDTDNVVLVAGILRAEGGDVEIKELTATVTPAGTGDASDIASQFILVIDGEEVQSLQSTACNVAGDCDGTGTNTAVDYTFDDVDVTIEEDEEVSIEIRADINDIDANAAEGDSLTVDIAADFMEAEDETGEDLVAADLDGVLNGEEQFFYANAFGVELVSVSETKTFTADDAGENDQGTFTIKFDVTAFGDTFYIRNAATATTTLDNVGYQGGAATDSGVLFNVTSATTTSATLTSTADLVVDGFEVDNNSTESFTLTVNVTAGTPAFQTVGLRAIEWALDSSADTGFFSAGLDTDWDTDPLFLGQL